MKEFLEPRLEVLQFYAEDILTLSGGDDTVLKLQISRLLETKQ